MKLPGQEKSRWPKRRNVKYSYTSVRKRSNECAKNKKKKYFTEEKKCKTNKHMKFNCLTNQGNAINAM